MLPLPGSPSSSWARFHERLKTVFSGASPRVCIAFWLFGALSSPTSYLAIDIPLGLINNVLYVVILSAALDLVGPNLPKGMVLLADVIPSFGTKLIAPYFIHVVPYSTRVVIFVFLSAIGMLLVALSPAYTDGASISTKIAGIILASLSSGGGELSFLGMTHFYGPFSLASWGSGTGAAGLVGAGAYALATTSLGFSVKATLLASACLPAVMVVSFFMILPRAPLHLLPLVQDGYQAVEDQERFAEEAPFDIEDGDAVQSERNELLQPSFHSNVERKPVSVTQALGWQSFKANLRRAKGLFFPLSVLSTRQYGLQCAYTRLACFHCCSSTLQNTPSTRACRPPCCSHSRTRHSAISAPSTRRTMLSTKWAFSFRAHRHPSSVYTGYIFRRFFRFLTWFC